MNIEEIKQLIELVNQTGVAELEVQRGENRVRIRRTAFNQEYLLPSNPGVFAASPAAPAPVANHAIAPAPTAAQTPDGSGASAVPQTLEEGHELVKSPIVGTYYECPAPGAPAFVRVGDHVEPGQVLCIIESMKLMNEIESEVSGTIIAKLVENGRPVEYGEALFAVRPR